mgnify:CR=1 FL=1
MPDRNDALRLLEEWVQNEGLRKHMLAVEASVPVVPVSFLGLRQVVREGGITPGRVRVRIHEALVTEEGANPVETLALRAETVIRDEVFKQ